MALHDPERPAPNDLGMTRQAIIDIGSNTVRLVIYEGSARVPEVSYNEKVTAKLGKAVAEDGKLSNKAMTAALAALARYAMTLRLQGITQVECVATAAVRDAANGAEFLARVADLGLAPRLISGEEEATYSARGVMAAFPGARGVVGDLGGGSLELIDVDGQRCTHGVSLPLGSLRLPRMRELGAHRFGRRVRKLLRDSDWQGAHGQTFYLVGGSWRALGRFAMLRDNWPVDDPHGYGLDPSQALKLARALATGGAAARAAGGVDSLDRLAPGISAARGATLPHAAALLAVLVRELKPARLVFSSWGLREGLLAARCPAREAALDPLLVSVEQFVAGPGDHAVRAGRACDWFARVTPGPGTPRETLRRAAVMLALASMRCEPNLRVEQASDWALRKRWIGADDEGRAMLALAVRANSARTVIEPDLLRLAAPAQLRQAVTWGLATRLCRRMTGLAPVALAETSLSIDGDRLILAARGDLAGLYTETVAKDLRLLAENLGLTPRFRAIEPGAPLP